MLSKFAAARLCPVVAIIVCLSPVATDAQEPIVVKTLGALGGGNAGTYYSSFGMSGGRRHIPNDTIQMLRMPQIKKELGLQDDQVETIGRLANEMRNQIAAVLSSADFAGGDVQQIMREAQKTIRLKTQEKLEELLVPRQLERLKQLKVQIALRNQGARAMLGGVIADEIHLSDKQREQLRLVQAKHDKELEEEIAALRKEYREKTLKEVLTNSQLQSLEKISGEEYEVQPIDYRSMYAKPKQVKPVVKE